MWPLVVMVVKMEKGFLLMISKFETLEFEEKDQIGFLTINRLNKLNALNIQTLRELKFALSELMTQKLKGLVVIGAGEKAFIAGADIAEMKSMDSGEAVAFSELGQQVTHAFEHLPYPVIAAVNGFSLGGGFEMALACDFIFATKNAVFGLPEVKLGLIPGFGGTQRLARVVGERRAREIMFSGRNVLASEAHELGIVLELSENRDELISAIQKWLSMTSQNSPYAVSRAKLALREGSDLTLDEGLKLERIEFANLFATEDMKEGTSAFLEKRKPNFKGQ